MKILNIGNNQIAEYIKLFNSDNINIFNINNFIPRGFTYGKFIISAFTRSLCCF